MIKPSELLEARTKAGLTQEEAASLVYTTERQWRKWEYGQIFGKSEKNNFKARSELFMYKVESQNKGEGK